MDFPALLQEIFSPSPRLVQATDCPDCWNTGLRGRDLCPCPWGQMRGAEINRRDRGEAAIRAAIEEMTATEEMTEAYAEAHWGDS